MKRFSLIVTSHGSSKQENGTSLNGTSLLLCDGEKEGMYVKKMRIFLPMASLLFLKWQAVAKHEQK